MARARHFSNVIAFDDAPFARAHRGRVLVVGVVFARTRLDGVLTATVQRDGADATRVLSALVTGSRFHSHVQAVLFQGIAVAGFNVIDIHALYGAIARPVLVVARRPPDMRAIERALQSVRGGARKWRLIERAGPMERIGRVLVQRAGLDLEEARRLLEGLTIQGAIPEPLRAAHLIAGGVTTGVSRGRA